MRTIEGWWFKIRVKPAIQKVVSSQELGSQAIQPINYLPFDNPKSEIDLDSINNIADDILMSAKQSAEKIIEEAKSSADEIKKNAFELGYQEGQKLAKESAKEAINRAELLFENGLREIASIKDKILDQAEDGIIQLIIEISKKLVCRELSENPETIITIIKESIKSAKIGNEIVIKINPNDLKVFEEHGIELIEHFKSLTFGKSVDLRVEEDSELSQGGCMVITNTNILDMTFETRLESLISAISNKDFLIENV